MAETLETIKKYTGPFSGSQMDQIFYEILNFTSERYAKGTANGQAVAAGTIGYNDNSYYYSRQALQSAQAAANAAARAESAVPAGINSAVLWTTDQSTALTDANKAVARKNIMAGGSNPNLLDNWWFGTGVVNQRGFTSVTATNNVYTIDRWKVNNGGGTNGTISLSSNGIAFAPGSNYITFEQHLKNPALLGQTLTLSFMTSDGSIYQATGTVPAAKTSVYVNTIIARLSGDQNVKVIVTPTSVTTYDFLIQFICSVGYPYTVKAVKLEKGTHSTLANDLPINLRRELITCKEYYREIELGSGNLSLAICMAYSAQAALMPNIFGMGNGMRKADAITLTRSGSWYLAAPDGTQIAITDMNVGSSGPDTATLQVFTAANALTKGTMYRLIGQSGAKLMFSNDL